ncbi:hypothetical protein [Streptomyces sp. NRRL F-5123]|uniref:hypothetical protein n=1 Tax=Streptomyces sp. NRRL F-5123 TaxID=1463856 RepID=UPI0004E109D6|nr:hypothetical protein [Streptomyces sp. NRRL F-5123]
MTTDDAAGTAAGEDTGAGTDLLVPLVEKVAALHREGRLAEAVDLMRDVVRRRLPERDPLDSANLGFLLQQTWDTTREPDTLREAIVHATHGLDAFEGEELDRRRDRLRQSWRLLHGTAGDDPGVLRDLPYVPGLLAPAGPAGARTRIRARSGERERLLHHRQILADLFWLTGGPDAGADLVDVCRALCAPPYGRRAERDEDTALLAVALSDVHDATGDAAARDEAITLLTALHESPAEPRLRAMYAAELAPLLDSRSAATGDPAETEQAVALLERAAEEAAPEHRGRLHRHRGDLLSGLARRTGAYAPLPEAAAAYRAALPALDPAERPACTAALAATLMHAAIRTRSQEQVDEAAELARAEVARAPHRASVEQALWHTLLRSVDDAPTTPGHCLALAALAREELTRPGDGGITALRWDRLGRILTEAASLTGEEAHLDEAVAAGRTALGLLPPGDGRAPFEANLAHALHDAGSRRRDRAALSEAADLLRRALSRTAPDDPDHPRMRGDLAGTLLVMNELEPEPGLLDEAFDHARAAADAGDGATDPLLTLAGALHQRAEHADDPQAADLAVDGYRQALARPLDPVRRAAVLANYGRVLHLRAERPDAATAPADLRAAVDALTEAVALAPDGHPDLLHATLSRLLVVCATLLGHDDGDPHLDLALPAWQRVLDRATAHGWTEISVATRQASHHALMARYHRHHRRDDLQQALAHLEAALDAAGPGAPDRADMLTSLGLGHRIRFGFTRALADLDRAVEAGTEGLDATGPDDPGRAHRLAHLSAHHRERYAETGAPADLASAVDLATAALELDPGGHATRTHLAAALTERFQATRDVADLSRAVDLYRAVRDDYAAAPDAAHGDGSEVETATLLNNLAGVLLTRYRLFAVPADLDEGIEAFTTVLQLTPRTHHSYTSRLVNVAQARLDRANAEHGSYPGAGRPSPEADLAVAVGYLETAVEELPPGSSQHRKAVAALLGAHMVGERRDPAAFDAVLARVLALVDDPEAAGPQWTHMAHNAALALADRWERTGAAPDLDRAVEIFRVCAGRGGAESVLSALQLGTCLAHRVAAGERPGDRAEAVRVLYGLASDTTAPARVRYRSVRVWLAVADREDGRATLDGCRLLLELLALAAWPGSPREAQESWLAGEGGVPAETARLALDAGEPAAAVEFLEQGRAVLWSRALDLRSDLAEVAAADADLAGRLLAVRDELEALAAASTEDVAPDAAEAAPGPDPDPDLLAELARAVELREAGDVDGMLAVLDELAEADDPWIVAAAETGRGLAFRDAGASDEARTAFARAAATGVGHAAAAAVALGDLLLDAWDLAGARAAYERAADLGDADAAGRLDLVATAEERRSEAARLTNSLVAGGDAEAMLHGVARLYEDAEYAEARILAELLMRWTDEAGQVAVGGIVGIVRAQAGDVAGAREALERALDGPGAPMAALVLGDLLVCEFTPGEARAAYRHALECPEPGIAAQARARLAALEPPAPATGPQPPPFDFARHFGHHLPEAEGVAALRAAQAAGDTRARTQLHLALLLPDERSADVFRRAVALAGPDDGALLLFCRAVLRRARGDAAGAGAAYEAAHRKALDAADAELACLAAVHLAQVRAALDDVPGATAAYRLAVQAGHPHLSPPAAFDLAGFLDARGDPAGAAEAYRSVLATGHPVQSGMAAVNLGGLLLREGDLEGARAAYVHALNGPWPDAAERARDVLARLPG